MCNLCNGTHTIHEIDSYFIKYHPCPNCGLVDERKLEEKYKRMRAKIAAAKAKLEAESA